MRSLELLCLRPHDRSTALPAFRRRALGQLASYDTTAGPITFFQRQRTILRVSLTTVDHSGTRFTSYNHIRLEKDVSLDAILREAQREVVEQEIFSILIKDAGNLPTASARVSERLIVLETAQNVELRFELVCIFDVHCIDVVLIVIRYR